MYVIGRYVPRLRTPAMISIKPTKKARVRDLDGHPLAYVNDISELIAVGPIVVSFIVPKIE